VEGIAAVRQRMNLTIRTSQGTDPLRPEFGSLVYKYADAPLPIAIPNIKKELLEALAMWVPDISVVAIKHFVKAPGQPVFELLYRVLDENVIDKLIYDLQAGTATTEQASEIILQASFPANPNGYRYQVELLKNGRQQFPEPNPSGFATIGDLFAWIQSNWFFVGKWYLLVDKIVCYMKADNLQSASLAIKVLPIIQLAANFPKPDYPGQLLKTSFLVNGVEATPAMPQTFSTPGEVLQWVNENWSQYADWSIEFIQENGNSIFSSEFSDDFDVPTTGYKLIGVSNFEGFVGQVTINAV